MEAIILAGGLATRLRPLTQRTPKILLPLAGNKPLCFYQIEWLKKYNIKELIFALGHLGGEVRNALKQGREFGVNITYTFEHSPLDTAGAIRNAMGKIKGKGAFLVLNGDIITDFNLNKLFDFHKRKGACLTICLTAVNEGRETFGAVACGPGGRIRRFQEKPRAKDFSRLGERTLINAGIYLFEQKAAEAIPEHKRYSFEKDLVPALLKQNEAVYGFVAEGYWQDIGIRSRYLKAKKDAARIRF